MVDYVRDWTPMTRVDGIEMNSEFLFHSALAAGRNCRSSRMEKWFKLISKDQLIFSTAYIKSGISQA